MNAGSICPVCVRVRRCCVHGICAIHCVSCSPWSCNCLLRSSAKCSFMSTNALIRCSTVVKSSLIKGEVRSVVPAMSICRFCSERRICQALRKSTPGVHQPAEIAFGRTATRNAPLSRAQPTASLICSSGNSRSTKDANGYSAPAPDRNSTADCRSSGR